MKLGKIIACGGIVMLLLAAWGMVGRAASSTKPTTEPSSKPSGKIVATVNGEPLYESEVLAAMPDDAFQEQLEEMKKAKLKRLVEAAVQSQFLKDRKIEVSDDQIDKAIKEFEQMVKTPGCPCCGGGYTSLEEYMKTNCYTMAELRRRVAADVGLKLYVDKLAKEMTALQALAEAVKNRRAQIEAGYVRGATISFDFYQDPNYFRDAKPIEAKKEKLANEAWQRLQKGDAFAKVAKEVSEDKASAPKGGQLGCVRADYLGREIEGVWRKLEPGTYSKPIKTNWGYCIVTREKLSDDDILSVLKEQAASLAEDQVYQEFKAAREGAKIKSGPDAALPSTVPTSGARP